MVFIPNKLETLQTILGWFPRVVFHAAKWNYMGDFFHLYHNQPVRRIYCVNQKKWYALSFHPPNDNMIDCSYTYSQYYHEFTTKEKLILEGSRYEGMVICMISKRVSKHFGDLKVEIVDTNRFKLVEKQLEFRLESE